MSENHHLTEAADKTGSSGSGLEANRALKRALRQVHRGQYVEAIGSLDAAIRLGADACDCYLRQAHLYQSLGQWREAILSAEKAVQRQPTHIRAREMVIALLIESREFGRAIPAIQRLLRIAPKHMAARDALAIAYMGLGKLDAALRVSNESVRMLPYDPIPRFRRALIQEYLGEAGMAVADLQIVLELDPDGTVADMAREHLDALDLSQIHDILLLAADDAVFRAKLVANPELAVMERGFGLSGWGLRRLAELASEDLARYRGPGQPSSYH